MVLLERREIVRHRIDGVGLKFSVERRVNLESFEMPVEAGNFRHEGRHVVGEIRRAAQPRRLGDLNRRRDRGGVCGVVDHARMLHHAEHDVAPLDAAIGMAPRIVQRRRLDHSNQRRRFSRRHLGQVLVEKISRRLRHPVDRRALVLAHRHVVDVALEDFILAQPNLEHRGDRELFELAAEAALVALHERARQLLRQRAGALGQAMRMQIGNRGLDDSDRIDSRMVVEKTILGVEQALHQVRLQLIELHLDPFGGRAGQQPADHLGLEHRVGLGDAERVRNDGDARALEAHAHHFGGILLGADIKRSQVNRDRVLRPGIFAGRVGRRHLRIAQLRQPIQQSTAIEVVAGDESEKARRRSRRSSRRDAARSARKSRRRVVRGKIPSRKTPAKVRRRRDSARAIRGCAIRAASSSPDSVSLAAARHPSRLLPHL